ncbi:uncharacterized protein LOC130936528 [Arachis stenosperma]|uniref:uncharacterized protein LOC130936528 n=1 Tax=Arachis stenosperma TaxID=217475 RepID=UPI0025AD496E|nr:uncharacterized protein LOC130936528 [Arachis stenosperma]
MTMLGSVAMLRTSPVRVDGHLSISTGPTYTANTGGVVIAQDRNSNILSIAFALMEGEDAESWSFFLSHLRQHMTLLSGILMISDRHNGIKATLEASDGGWLPPAAYHAFCIQYMASNFSLTFKGKDARRLLVNVANRIDILQTEDPAMCDWANRIKYAMWTQHWNKGRKFGHMMTNISKCVNLILKGVRNLFVCSLVKSTYSRDNSEFTVAETIPTGSFSLGSYRVSLRPYVHKVYLLSSVFSVIGFIPTVLEDFWPPYDGLTFIPNSFKRCATKGCPRTTRIRTTMDEADSSRPMRCGLYRQPGHTCRTCPQGGVTTGTGVDV